MNEETVIEGGNTSKLRLIHNSNDVSRTRKIYRREHPKQKSTFSDLKEDSFIVLAFIPPNFLIHLFEAFER